MSWVRPVAHGWVVRDEVPGPDVDEFAEPDRIATALAQPGAADRTLLAVQHPHRTPAAMAAHHTLLESLPAARKALTVLLRRSYRPVDNVVGLYEVDGLDGRAVGVLCIVDPAAVDTGRVRHSEEVYLEIVAERGEMLAGIGVATSAAMLVPIGTDDVLTPAVHQATAGRPADVATVDSRGRRHRLWLTEDTALLDLIAAGQLVVADGNHRVAAAAAAGLGGMLALVTAGPDLRIGAFHRVLTGTGHTATDLATAWRRVGLTVHETRNAPTPTEPGTLVARCSDTALVVTLPPGLDHATVETLLLNEALHLDPEDDHVHPLAEGRTPPPDTDAVLEIAPVPLATVLAEHAAGRRMPRKSTYFTPKPRSGLLLADLR